MHLLPDSAEGTLAAAEHALRRRRQAEVDVLELAAHWADLHPKEALFKGASAVPGAERAGMLGGEGTPCVREFAAAELGAVLELHPHGATALIADALDLQFRLPQLWEVVRELRLDSWLARKAARRTRELSTAQAAAVDDRLADVAGSLPPTRLLDLIESLVLACNTETAEQRRAEELASRFVRINQSTQHGTKGLYAKLDVADAIRLDATIDRLARALPAETGTLDVRRAMALGQLADPGDAQRRLDGEGRQESRPPVTLYLHITESDFTRDADGVARFDNEGGPITLTHAREILGHAHVTIKPVIDLAHAIPSDAYEFTGSLREAVFLRTPADSFPYAVNRTRRMEIDHVFPYVPDGPPGQTRLENGAPLTRRHHRIATHGGWRRRQISSGVVLWRTPHGRCRLTDHRGTHRVDPEIARPALDSESALERQLDDLLIMHVV